MPRAVLQRSATNNLVDAIGFVWTLLGANLRHSHVWLSYGPRLERWLLARHRLLPEPPALAPGCVPAGAGHGPRILSPPLGQVLVLLPGVDPADQEVPLAADADAPRLAWFVDGTFLGHAAAGEELWWTPAPGRHEFLVSDEAGRSAKRVLEVRYGGGVSSP